MCDFIYQFIPITCMCLSQTRTCDSMASSVFNVLRLELVVRFAEIVGHHCLTILFLIYIIDFCRFAMAHYTLHVLTGSSKKVN